MTVRDSITRTRARAPGVEGDPPSKAVHDRVLGPTLRGITEADHEVQEPRTQTIHHQLKPAPGMHWSMYGLRPRFLHLVVGFGNPAQCRAEDSIVHCLGGWVALH